MTAFEDGLWSRLVEEHAADRVSLPARRTRRSTHALVGGGVVAIAAAAAIAISVLGGSAPAYALTRNANGTITLSIYRWSRVNIPQINARFAQLGSRWRVVPDTASCATPWPPKGNNAYEIVSSSTSGAKSGSVTPGPIPRSVVGLYLIAAGPLADGRMAMTTVSMPGPMPRCLPPAALVPAGYAATPTRRHH